MLTIRPATLADAAELAPSLRPHDVAEVWSSDGWTPYQALSESLQRSQRAFAVCVDGELAALGGYAPTSLLSNRAQTWFLTGHAIAKEPLAYIRMAKLVVHCMLEDYDEVFAYVDSRYDEAVRFFRMVGFRSAGVRVAHDGTPFHHITARRESWAA